MRTEPVFNPLDKKNLGTSVADALLDRERSALPPAEKFIGAGVYAIYYAGDFEPYRPIARRNQSSGGDEIPIYVGKAVPKGARKGGFGLDSSPGTVLYDRLAEHAESIRLSTNLQLEDFYCRYLSVDDIWIPLGENLLIEEFKPLWNRLIDGFGNHDPGRGRYEGRKPAWDVLHPGRIWAERLKPGKSREQIIASITEYLAQSLA